jgi:hypothetical protein
MPASARNFTGGRRKARLDVGINLRLRDIETKQHSSNFVHFFFDSFRRNDDDGFARWVFGA